MLFPMRHHCVQLGHRICISVTFVALCGLSGIAQDVKTKAALKSADNYIASQVLKGSFRGAVLVGMNGKIVFEKGYGLANEEWGIPNSPSTEYRIFSMTKQFTGACILLLEERGLLNVQDPVSKYVSDLPESWQMITIHQLLTHTSGIPNNPDTPRARELDRLGAKPRELLAIAATLPLEFKPGTQLHYSNSGYVLLGMIIEKVSGLNYAEFLKKNIFEPLGMKHSGYDDQSLILKNRASGYSIRDGQVINADPVSMTVPFAAGGIYSTVEDIFLWNEALTVPGLLFTAHSLEQMFAVYPETTAYGGQNYGYGVVIAHRFGKLLYYHGGGWNGFESVLQRYPAERICIVVLANTDHTTPWDMGDHVASALFGQPLRSQIVTTGVEQGR
jgi:D-alanyl-D-alanine carboxypeptidase